jgi:P27 family predicted phage terminase small subunit
MSDRTPPTHLHEGTATWWEAVVEEYELEDHHLKLLTLAAETWDRCREARETLAEEGTYYNDRFGQPKAHPAVAVERDSRIAFARLMRELDLDGDPLPPPKLPGM